MGFEIKLPLFEGPFDLLLFFIQRDELDIHDIPIAQITDDFLEYLRQLEEMDIEAASEFILVAATLMRIKAKMLLPRKDLDEEGNEIDPRNEFFKPLLEYKKYKSIIPELETLELERSLKEKRGNVISELESLAKKINVEAELQDLDLYKLLKVFIKLTKNYEIQKNKPTHKVFQYPYSIEDQKKYLLSHLKKSKKISFIKIIEDYPDKIWIIYNFLAILELIQIHIIKIHIGLGYNNFWISKTEEVENKQLIVDN